ncbi:MAG TPA: SBBP repeat-containing protein [Verrucomicrobiota bacterium]|nr:SBBP repeat-containing protein [Verrucomicrobiota bacterium]HQB16197.1 SBBP repeat-containing protein [Verrucomicrobiota bacterium]
MKRRRARATRAGWLLVGWLIGGLVLAVAPVAAQGEGKIWSRLIGAASYDFGGGVAVDPAGNVVFSGTTQSALGGPLAGAFDVFAGKCDASGNLLWLAQRGTPTIEYGWDTINAGAVGGVATDPFGNVYVVGRTDGALDGNTLVGGFDFFVMKFSPTGDWLWTRQDGTGLHDDARAVTTDRAGNVLVTGFVRGDFHGEPRVGSADVFINQYSPDGVRRWTVLFGSAFTDEPFGIACDAEDNVVVTGWTDGSMEGEPYLANGDLFLAKYTAQGQRVWLREWGTWNKDTGYALATDADRNIYLAGYTGGPLYGTPQGGRDVFLAKFDAEGKELWGTQFGDVEHDQGWGVACDGAGQVYLAGQASGPLGADPAGGGLDVFLAKYNPKGQRIWLRQLGTTADDLAHAVAADAQGNVYVTGWSYGDWDGHTNAGQADVLLLKYGPTNLPPPAPTALPATALTLNAFTANWHPAIPATGYRLDVAADAAFTQFLPGYQDREVGTALSHTVGGLAPGTTSYYRVRAVNAYGTSDSSATITATTVIPICTPATLKNGSFEGNALNGVGEHWTGYRRAPNPPWVSWTLQTAAPPAGAGQRYQQIQVTNSLGGGAGVRQTVTGCAIGATYVVAGWMRGNSIKATCTVKVSPDASTDWTTAIHLNPPQTYAGADWTRFSGTVVATGTNMTLWLDAETTVPGPAKAACFDGVTVTCLVPPAPLKFETIHLTAQGRPQLRVSGTPGAPVAISRSDDFVTWTTLTNLWLSHPAGTGQVMDASAIAVPRRFYRATSP